MTDTTHRTEAVHVDESIRQADCTMQWMLEHPHNAGTHPISSGNELDVLICGQEAFGRLAKDIEDAQHSIDLICWGFDPGMELVRTDKTWPRGQPYGSLLHAAASRGVKVRLLVWHEPGMAAKKQNNMPGLTGDQRGGYLIEKPRTTRENLARLGIAAPVPTLGGNDSRTPEQLRNDYCVDWWRDVQASAKASDASPRIEFLTRKGNKAAVQRSLASETDKPETSAAMYGVVNEKSLIEDHATHHQKTVLIDYAWDEGSKAVGYVMGLNSVTDYWDTAEHLFDTPLREVDWARASATAQALPKQQKISRDPFQDYACRTVGPALQGVHKNFVDAWKRAGGKLRSDDDNLLPKQLARAAHCYNAQIVRTQPEENDKTIKETYFHAPQFARNYIYVENQYFFYESWVRNLKEKRATHMEWLQKNGVTQSELRMLHLFVVIPSPENDGMVPRTYDTVKSLGEADSFPTQDAAMNRQAEAQKAWEATEASGAMTPEQYQMAPKHDPVADAAAQVQAPKKNHSTGEVEGLGMKVKIGRLITANRGKPLLLPESNVRQVYIHSKLMIIDDSFFTLGSANLNQRSMSGDSEINIATDDHLKAKGLRSRCWEMHAGMYKDSSGGDGSAESIVKAFKSWFDVMDLNEIAVSRLTAITGHLVPFKDKREIHYRLG